MVLAAGYGVRLRPLDRPDAQTAGTRGGQADDRIYA